MEQQPKPEADAEDVIPTEVVSKPQGSFRDRKQKKSDEVDSHILKAIEGEKLCSKMRFYRSSYLTFNNLTIMSI